MHYTYRLATLADAEAIAPLWAAFAAERAAIDPSMAVKPNFDFYRYIEHQLTKPLTYTWVLETTNEIVGCLVTYFYDEAPPPALKVEWATYQEIENPFVFRRVGSVLGLYVQPEHRQPETIFGLAERAIAQAEELKITDIDLLIGADQTGLQALLKRAGFTQAAMQFTKHYPLTVDRSLPSLHPPLPTVDGVVIPTPEALPLYHGKTGELIYNPQGNPVFLYPLRNDSGEFMKTESGLPIYPTPLRDPETQDFIFDQAGNLVTCPVLQDEDGKIIECEGIPQFRPPAYGIIKGKLTLKQDESGQFIFCDVQKKSNGEWVRSPSGMPVFQLTPM